jgi:ankyrin repeat protein
MAKLLLSAGASPNGTEYDGLQCPEEFAHPLIIAVMKGDPTMVALLLEAGAAPDFNAGEGFSPLYLAVSRSDARVCAVLISGGADPLFPVKMEYRSALELADRLPNRRIQALLKQPGKQSAARAHL